jgi:Putative transposase
LRERFGGLVNLNVHFHVVVPDGVFGDDGDGLVFVMHPVPTSADVLAILDRIVRRVAAEARGDGDTGDAPDVLAQVQAEAAATSRSPTDGKPTVRGTERPRVVRGFLVACRGGDRRAGTFGFGSQRGRCLTDQGAIGVANGYLW